MRFRDGARKFRPTHELAFASILTPTQRGAVAEAVIAADAFGIYCHETNGVLLRTHRRRTRKWEIRLRLARARNNQEIAITYAADHEFHGAIAQLGERVTGSHEVAGSSPASSTGEGAA